ncbi:MAG TPA: sulfatase-like hydrolase/transferase, partial [Phycisphaerae bacterium]|nr:sulfatase-like hydrolase/transferase [Phycisphaerae bacterium]
MMRHDIPTLMISWLFVTFVVLASAKAADRPNIILLMSDDQGWGETSYNGHPYLKTPVLDEMASSGLRLDRFYAASPVCSPTRASCMTGRHANRSGAFGAGWSTRPEEVTVAQILKKAGYRTGHYGKWHIGAVKKESPLSPINMGFDECLSHDNFFEMNPQLSRNGGPLESFKGDGSEVIVDEALKFARKVVKEGKPFFIVIWFGSPHRPYSGYEKDIAPFEGLGENIARRFAEITAMDRAIGTLRNGLDEMKVRENTLLWFNSDNGVTIEDIPEDQRQHLYNGGLRGHKAQLYEGGLRVPGIIEWPRVITTPRVSKVPCVTSDILPTLIDIVGVDYPKLGCPLDGISLKRLIVEGTLEKRPKPIGFWGYNHKAERENEPWLEDASLNEMITIPPKSEKSKKPAFANHKHPKIVAENFRIGAAWLTGRYKLLMPGAKGGKEQVPELYDLEKDPEEKNNIASQNPEI